MSIKRKGSKFLVESSSKKDVYTVDVEQPFCDCPDFIYRAVKEEGTCKHIEAVKKYLKS